MSLINDALKRAKAAQEQAPPEPPHAGPQFRPVEAQQAVRHGVGIMVPIGLATMALLILLLAWLVRQHLRQGESTPVRAAETQKAAGISAVDSSTPHQNGGESIAGGATQPAQANAPGISATPVSPTGKMPGSSIGTNTQAATSIPAPLKPPAATTPEASGASTASATNGTNTASADVQALKPALPKLQGIVFNPRRPSAVINGKTLFVGDRVAGFRVMAIGRDTATLVGPGQTNVLTLEE